MISITKVYHSRCFGTIPLIMLCLLLCSPTLLAQYTTASLSGQVVDTSGLLVNDAKVTVVNVGTNDREITQTSEGTFQFPRLAVGMYSLIVECPGFLTYKQDGIVLSVNRSASVDVTLKVGRPVETISVSADADLITSNTATVGQLINQREILDLPLNGRQAQTLVFLAPGAADLTEMYPAFGHQGGVYPNSQQASVNGSDPGSVSYLLDGGDHNDTYVGINLPFPNPDAIQEFSLEANNLSAEYGSSPSAVVNVVMKSGTNVFHGGVFEFIRNGDLNAKNYFAPIHDSLKRNQFGGTIGGPILRDKLFFFGSYQGTRTRSTSESEISQVPTQAERNGDFSSISTQLVDPVSGIPFHNNQIPQSRFSAPAEYFLKYIPLPNGPGTQLTYAGPSLVQNDDQATVKLDYSRGRSQMSGHYFFTNFSEPPALAKQNLLASDTQGNHVRVQDLGASYTYTISPSSLLTSWFSWNSQTGGSLSSAPFGFPTAGVNIAAATPPELVLVVNGYFQIQTNHEGIFDRGDWTVRENYSRSKGSNQLSIGVDLVRLNNDLVNTFQQSSQIAFSNNLSGNNLADFFLGRISVFKQAGGQFKNMVGTRLGLYVQDNWQARKNLVLNAGFRWDPYLPYLETKGRVPCFIPGDLSVRYPNAPAGLVYGGDPGCPKAGSNPQYKNFGPRLGFAYRPNRGNKTSIRGGAGFYYIPPASTYFNNLPDVAPFSPSFQLSDVDFVDPYGSAGIVNPFPAQYGPALPSSNVSFTLPVAIPGIFPTRNFNMGQEATWNLLVEQQLAKDLMLRIAYVGNKDTHLFNHFKGGGEGNAAIYVPGQSTEANTQQRRFYSDFSNIGTIDSEYNANYNALEVTGEKRFGQGIYLLANYTWSKKIDNFGGSDPFNTNFDHGVAFEDLPSVFHLSGVWHIPGGDFNGGGILLKGWEISFNLLRQSGFPIMTYSGVDNSFSGNGSDRPDYLGVNKSEAVLPSNRSHAAQVNQWFETNVFTVNPVGTFGNAPKSFPYGPRLLNTDMALMKNTRIGEHVNVQFRAEFFNVFNTVNFGAPDSTVTDSTFGQISSAADPRILQFGLKFAF